MAKKFELPEIGTAAPSPTREAAADSEPQPAAREPSATAAEQPHAREPAQGLPAGEIDGAGHQLAAGIEAAGYHPVVLFGNANSGKTSLLLSLFALLRTEPQLATGLELGDPIISVDTPYGRFLREQAEGFYGRKTQDFIEGTASPKTAIDAPFFIPVIVRPEGKPEVRLAFMESNGEWYRADRSNDRLFPVLRRQIEELLASYQGPITFIHLLPYTQQAVYGTGSDQLTDSNEMKEASLAIAGALYAYQKVRANQQDDRHLVLVTKWDAHERNVLDRAEVLQDPGEEPENFANERYAQAISVFKGLGLSSHQQQINAYCAGIISGQTVSMPRQGDELRSAVLNYPTQLWRWLYRCTLEQLGERPIDPFPTEPRPNWLARLLNQLF